MDFKKLESSYFPSGAPSAKIAKDENAVFIERRFNYMNQARNDWYLRVHRTFKMWDVFRPWLLEGENFSKAVRFPTLRDVATAIRNEILRTPPEVSLEAEFGEHPHRAQALDFAVKELKEDPYELRVKEDCINDMLFTGLGWRFVSFFENKREIDGKLVIDWNGTGTERNDPMDVWVDESGRNLWDPKKSDMKRDLIRKKQYPYSLFKSLFGSDPRFINVDAVTPFQMPISSDSNYNTTAQTDAMKDINQAIVNVYEYMNHEVGYSSIIANGVTIKAPTSLPCGRIPAACYIFEKRRDSFYPNSLAEIIAPHIYAKDTIFNLELQGLKLSLMPVTLIDSESGYSNKIHKFGPKAVWQMAVPQGKSVTDLVAPLNKAQRDGQGAYNMLQQIESELTIASGQDRRALHLSPGELATQTAAKNQSMQRAVNALVFSNEIEAEAQITELMIDYIKKYDAVKIETQGKNGKIKKRYKRVKVNGYKVEQNEGEQASFEPAQGVSGMFELNEESIDTNVRVKVKPTRLKMLLQEQRVAKLMQAIPQMIQIAQAGSQINPEMMKMIDFEGIIEQIAEANDMNLQKTIKSTTEEMENRIKLEHKGFFTEIDVPIPQNEGYKESEAHLKEHMKLRYVYRNGKNTFEETTLWKSMTPQSQKKWNEHIALTLANIKAKLEEALNDNEEIKKEVMQEDAMKAMAQKPQVQAPAGRPSQPSENIADKTMLNRGTDSSY